MARAFSLGDDGSLPEEQSRRLVVKLAAWVLVVRVVLALWVIVYPDSRFFNSIDSLSIAPIVNFYVDGMFKDIPANDSYFYWIIALHGAGSWDPEMGWRLVNFSQVFPVIIAVVKPIFSTWSPYIINTVFAAITPWFLVGFLNSVIKNPATARRIAIAVLFNPIFLAYSIYGLTEPLHYLLLFAVLSAHYKSGILWRIVEYSCLVIFELNRFIGIILATFYVYKVVFARGTSLKQRVLWLVPVVVLSATYVGWEWICLQVFGHTPSEARTYYWHHGFNLDPTVPLFIVKQFPMLLAGAMLGLLLLVSVFSSNEEHRKLEATEFERIDVQACVAMAAVFFVFIGLINTPISLFRYVGTMFPLFAVMLLRFPTNRYLPVMIFGIVMGVVMAHLAAICIMFFSSPPIPSLTALDVTLCTIFTISFFAASFTFFIKRHLFKSDNAVMLVHLLLAILLAPLALYFP
nr:hypothetical protein [Candidatus Sigynarchaeum springense]